MNTTRAGRIALLLSIVVVAMLPVSVSAEDSGDSHDNQGTVQIGPVSKGPVVSQGTAGYDPNGITATA
ncbi:MAG: hypothetical protein ACREOY_15415, partial [Candidatus Dormibacteraceae bacterium]